MPSSEDLTSVVVYSIIYVVVMQVMFFFYLTESFPLSLVSILFIEVCKKEAIVNKRAEGVAIGGVETI